jgi:predicted RNA-binding Zn-ribbon protein involved in translation (DUF1610 family)
MVNQQQAIPCPSCKTSIPFEIHQLLMGMQFVCPNCHAVLGLAPESREIVQETIEKFDEIKRNSLVSKNTL